MNQCCQLSRQNRWKQAFTTKNKRIKIISFNLLKNIAFSSSKSQLSSIIYKENIAKKKIPKTSEKQATRESQKKYREGPWKQATFRLFPAILATLARSAGISGSSIVCILYRNSAAIDRETGENQRENERAPAKAHLI